MEGLLSGESRCCEAVSSRGCRMDLRIPLEGLRWPPLDSLLGSDTVVIVGSWRFALHAYSDKVLSWKPS